MVDQGRLPANLITSHHSSIRLQSYYPIIVGLICFFAGTFCSTFITPFQRVYHITHDSKRDSVQTSNLKLGLHDNLNLGTHHHQPIGLTWLQQGYDNPWQFSTMRTDIDDLENAFRRVIKRDGKLPRVVVSFTSLPKRFIKHARPMVEILKQQSYMPDVIYICIPKGSRRSNDTFDIPKWMLQDDLIKVLRPEIDYGPATKLIPVVKAEQEMGNTYTRIVTVDDDDEGHWTSDSLLRLVAYSLHYENEAIGLTGWNVTCMIKDARCNPKDSGIPARQHTSKQYNFIKQADDFACHSLADWKTDYYANCMGAVRKNFVAFADVIEGYKGALYQPRFFRLNEIESIKSESTPKYFFLCDDVWFSGWLGVHNISRLIVNPAIHENAAIRLRMVEYSNQRNISRQVVEMSEEDRSMIENVGDAERGLHLLGMDFVKANYLGVRWFDEISAWPEGLWTRPEGFKYLSEQSKGKVDRNW